MFDQIKRTGKETIIYGISGVLTSSTGFLLLPVYTRFLSPSDYGKLELLDVTTKILSMFLVLGVTTGMFRSYFSDRDADFGYRNMVVSTTFNFCLIVHFLVYLFLVPLLGPISKTLLGSPEKKLLTFALMAVFFANMSDINMRLYRLKEQALKFVCLDLSGFFVMVFLNILFVVWLRRGVLGILGSRAISYAMLFLISLPVLIAYLQPRIRFGELKEQLQFGIPFVPMNLAAWVLLASDRYFLRYYSNFDEIGLYSLGCKFGLIIVVLINEPFFLSWGPRMYKIEKEKMAPQIFARTLTYFFGTGIFICLALGLFAKECIMLMTTEAFYQSYKVVPIMCFALLLGGMQRIITVGLYLKRKTAFFPLTYGGAALINLFLNYLMVPRIGMMGAAVATLSSYVALSILNLVISNHLYFIPYEKGRVLKIFVIALVLYCLHFALPIKSGMAAIAIKIGLFGAFPFLMYVCNVFYLEEIRKIRALIYATIFKFRNAQS